MQRSTRYTRPRHTHQRLRRLGPWAALALMLCALPVNASSLSWGYGGNLTNLSTSVPGAPVSATAGWRVQLYADPDTTTSLGAVTAFDRAGQPSGGNSEDDQLLADFSDVLLDGKGGLSWGDSYEAPNLPPSGRIYTVLFAGSDPASAAWARIVDSTPFSYNPNAPLPVAYTLDNVAHDWTPITPLAIQPPSLSGSAPTTWQLNALPGRTYSLQFTTNLADTAVQWTTLQTVTASGTPITLTDTNATDRLRIYRIEELAPSP